MDMILGKCKLQNSFLIYSSICCWYTLELPHRGNSNVYLKHVFSINKFFTISFFKNKFSTMFTFNISVKGACINEQASCSFLCSWMTIKDCLFYAFDS